MAWPTLLLGALVVAASLSACTYPEEGGDAEIDGDCKASEGCIAEDTPCTRPGCEDSYRPGDEREPDRTPLPDGALIYLRINDLAVPDGGETPGSDLLGVELVKANGEVHFLREVYEAFDHQIVEFNAADNPESALGPPSEACDPSDRSSYYSMGGTGAYLIAGFGDVAIERGDSINVYEFGETNCGGPYLDESYEVLVSSSRDARGPWVSVGEGWGTAFIPVRF